MTNADFNQVISRSNTYSTQWDYVQDRFGEKNLLPFTISDTDFKVPDGTLLVLEDAVKKGVFGYTRWNHADFKDSTVNWFEKRFAATLEPDWLVYSPSVLFSIAKILELVSQPKDTVLTLMPCYDAFIQTVTANQRQLIGSDLVPNEAGYFEIDFQDVEKQIKQTQAKVFLLCSPHNPTGRVWRQWELEKLMALCHKYELFVISDEIHMDILRAGQRHLPITMFQKLLGNRLALVSSSSKTFNTPSLIFSYCVIPDFQLREAFLGKLKAENGLSSASYLGLLAHMECYNREEQWVNQLCQHMDQEFLYLEKELNQIAGIKFTIPEASYLAWIHVADLGISMDQLQKKLVNRGKVALMRGDTYGVAGTNYLRMNIGASHNKIQEGITRLKIALS
ncbi:MalY/PatB family protein [Carnobacterium gallinarum]|uniref:MalY/PatB family protein n=1 Tax=Carnobacterium gallinarum TaxID=2749 RepID=UPI0005587F8C|nr:aminotransferase class I/II-fold pyridoxal phosphate-dependent enzyme [Carnobacterium gallinarum]